MHLISTLKQNYRRRLFVIYFQHNKEDFNVCARNLRQENVQVPVIRFYQDAFILRKP